MKIIFIIIKRAEKKNDKENRIQHLHKTCKCPQEIKIKLTYVDMSKIKEIS